jgi:cob(I)alamin adenosyltransferase
MKIYTKTGDDGTTGLIGGSRVRKDDAAIECYGTVDELNASLGLAAVVADEALSDWLRKIQGELFTIGSHLATPTDEKRAASLPEIDASWITRLESQIDDAEKSLPPLKNFILPGGTELAARLHLARTVCRRAERSLVNLHSQREVDPVILTYMNRLSDWLFVTARRANHAAGVADVPWTPNR